MGTIAGIAFLAMMVAAPALGGGDVTYEKDIRPIVAARCSFCHGPDSPSMEEFDRDKDGFKKKGKGPRLDTYAHLMDEVRGSDAGALMRRLDDGKNTKDGKPGNMHARQGCLNVPGFNSTVARPMRVVVRGFDRHGVEQIREGTGLLARAFQHEMDHLDGRLFVDRLRGFKRDLVVRKVQKLRRAGKW